LIGLCDIGAYSAVAFGFGATSHPSVIVVLSSTFSLPTLLLARVFLKERLGHTQKLAACTILAGTVLVALR
jgi:drug/metabolite transporter (DMT)-like permease